jgi:hypothetical protein
MAASDHLNGQQFFHGTPHQFNPGDELTREGAFRAKHSEAQVKIAQRYGIPTEEDHLYYGDKSFLSSGEAAGYGSKEGGGNAGHVYAVEPLTASGRKPKSHQPDPNYTAEGMTGAYRTKGKLRVLHEVDHEGNPL